MIIRNRPNLFQLFFIVRGSVLTRILPQILVSGGISALVVFIHQVKPGALPNFSGAPFALFGTALSVFMVFRNNACYDRWWEARRHWGELIFAARSLARQTLILEESDPQKGKLERQRLLRLTMAFAQALVLHLRPGGAQSKVSTHFTPEDLECYQKSLNPPDSIIQMIAHELADLRQRGRIGDIPYQILDKTLGQMSSAQIACERIRTTPIPFGYTLLLHRTAYLFCFLLPFGFADTLGWGTPFAASLVAYNFFGLDVLGDDLEEPFGKFENDLPIEALADTIEINLREALGEDNLPSPPSPKNYILM